MVQFLGPETDRMCQFLGPETDVMGERYYISSTGRASALVAVAAGGGSAKTVSDESIGCESSALVGTCD